MSYVVTDKTVAALMALAAPSPQDEFSDSSVSFDSDLKKIIQDRETKKNQQAKEELADLIISLLDSSRSNVDRLVHQIRTARREEKAALARLERVNRATAYLKATGNAGPLLVILSPVYTRQLIASGCIIEVPESFSVEKSVKKAAKVA